LKRFSLSTKSIVPKYGKNAKKVKGKSGERKKEKGKKEEKRGRSMKGTNKIFIVVCMGGAGGSAPRMLFSTKKRLKRPKPFFR
jgi:hypothetical protein